MTNRRTRRPRAKIIGLKGLGPCLRGDERRGICADHRHCWREPARRHRRIRASSDAGRQDPARAVRHLAVSLSRRGAGQEHHLLDVVNGERRGHTSLRGGVYWEDLTYSDRRVLLSIPRGFDIRRPALIVVYFHGNLRDAHPRRARPPAGAAPARGVRASTPCWWRRNSPSTRSIHRAAGSGSRACSREFLDEAAGKLARLHGDPRARAAFERAPVVIVAYSGGYNPAAFALAIGGANRPHARRHAARRACSPSRTSSPTGSPSSRRHSSSAPMARPPRSENAELQRMLTERGVGFSTALPARLDARQRDAS